jgi:hypothetical protein
VFPVLVETSLVLIQTTIVTAQQPGNFIPDLPAISWELPTFESVPANLNLNIPLDESTVAESLDWVSDYSVSSATQSILC